jgi:hypothetical protein
MSAAQKLRLLEKRDDYRLEGEDEKEHRLTRKKRRRLQALKEAETAREKREQGV